MACLIASMLILKCLFAVRAHQMLPDNTTRPEGETCLSWTKSGKETCPLWTTLGKETCPPWTKPGKNTPCECITDDNKMACCQGESLKLAACYCLSYYQELNMTVIGNCLYSCSLQYYQSICEGNLTATCDQYSRTGELCSQCKEGTGRPLYSYSLHCIPCKDNMGSVIKYMAAAFLPLTLFYVIVVAFRISATSDTLSGFILTSQIVSTPAQLRYINSLSTDKLGTVVLNAGISLHAIRNLDFFRSSYPPFCYQTTSSALLIASLDYIIALYPLGLILLTFLLVRIHDRFHIVACAWEPVHKFFSCMRHHSNVRKSLVDAFVTFIVLSYIKILNASVDILLPTTLYNMSGNAISRNYLYYDGSIRILHGKHIRYALLAITMMLIFNVAPLLLLLLYPCHCFQSLLNRCRPSLFQPLHIFMDSFQGCY